MLGERSIGPLDLRIVKASLDDGHLGVVRHQKPGNAANGFQGADMGCDPVREALRPRGFRVGEARCAQHRHENLCFAPFAGEPVDDDRHRVARVIHEQLLPGGVGLAHDHRQLGCEGPVQLAEARIAQAIRLLGDVLLPQDRQGDMLALQLAMDGDPVRLRLPRRPGLGAAFAVKPLFKLAVAEPLRQRPAQTRGVEPNRGEADRARAILLTLNGWTSARIAEVFRVREDTVRFWRGDFARGGVEAVKASVYAGPPPLKTEAALRVCVPLLEAPVANRANWTIPRLIAEIKKRELVDIGPSQLSKALRKKTSGGGGHGTR